MVLYTKISQHAIGFFFLKIMQVMLYPHEIILDFCSVDDQFFIAKTILNFFFAGCLT
ncbi:hypothetical protein CP8484711_1553 [Chlamydia psittaci 84-8471/1]|nr:hypothetical protein CP8484711_1553 [Chlamydia psittaci 84-8471/1]